MNRPDPPGERRSAEPPIETISRTDLEVHRSRDADVDDDSRSDQTALHYNVDDEECLDDDDNYDLQQEPGEGIAILPSERGEDITTTEPLECVDSIDERPASDPILDYEPNYSKTEAISFHVLCTRLEKMWQQRHLKKNRQSKDDVFSLLIDDSIRHHLSDSSWFPLLRLVLPDLDTSRPHTGMKERNIAMAWGEAFDLTPGSRHFDRLLQYQDPTYFARSSNYAVSDLSMAVHEIVEPRDGTKGSLVTVKQMNNLLDELVALKGAPIRRSNHDWREGSSPKKLMKGPSLKQKRRDWVRTLRARKLSALEHKWVVRILLQKMEYGFSSKSVLSRWMPGGLAIELYRMNNNLRKVCIALSNPHWLHQREEIERGIHEEGGEGKQTKIPWMERPKGEAVLGNTIVPMLALKVYFRDAMAELCRDHRTYAKRSGLNLLPVKNPAILCEVKLDGERMVVHVQRGIVTMHTRRGRWYSDLYSAALAPSVRRAIAKWDVDVILDGEVIAWDDGKQETIPFGNNRTVALARERWMESQGLVEARDRNLHQGQADLNVMRRGFIDADSVEGVTGSECWLRYEVFDILHVSGPDAIKLLSMTMSSSNDVATPGSVIHLDGFHRKRILHHLVTPQEKEVVLVPALVVRPNGDAIPAETYFSRTNPTMENGYHASTVDSIAWGLDSSESEREVYDHIRRNLSDAELSARRTESVDRFYSDIVDVRGLEGVLLKDLNACYLLEGRKYWCKHKPDYEENSKLGDIDLLILGAYHGTGMGPSGKFNAFLCGCVDDDNPDTFIAVVKVNAGGVSREVSDQILESTGYKKQTDTEPWVTGQWFRGDFQGKKCPDFISKRSFPHTQGRPPTFDKKKYPDLWIHPDDSIVLTLKAGEIVASDGFQAGVTLRFPRIERVRMKNSPDDKDPGHAETLEGLLRMYREQMQRREGSGEITFQSGCVASGRSNRMFSTAEEGLKKKSAQRAGKDDDPDWTMPIADRKDSSALDGLTIVALEGIYHLDERSLDAEEAKEHGWFELIKGISCRDDLLSFISKHGGIPKISTSPDTDFVVGGRADDSRVAMHQKGLDNAIRDRGRRRIGLSSEHMIKIGGVLKWTYLVAMIHLWKKDMKLIKVEPGQTDCTLLRSSSIKSTHPHLLDPPRHQYLVSSCPSAKDSDGIFGISMTKTCTMIDLKRGIQEVSNDVERQKVRKLKNKPEFRAVVPWQFCYDVIMDAEIRRCLDGQHTIFWPYKKQGTTSNIIIYPDLFERDFGERESKTDLEHMKTDRFKERWDRVATESGLVSSCLPLARAMGAQVTPNLHDGVTHVLCELKEEVVLWTDSNCDLFVHPERAREIIIRLSDMHKSACNVLFVSPDWLRGQWFQAVESSTSN